MRISRLEPTFNALIRARICGKDQETALTEAMKVFSLTEGLLMGDPSHRLIGADVSAVRYHLIKYGVPGIQQSLTR